MFSFTGLPSAQKTASVIIPAGASDKPESIMENAGEQKKLQLNPGGKVRQTENETGKDNSSAAKPDKKTGQALKKSKNQPKTEAMNIKLGESGCPAGMLGVEIRVYTLKNGIYVNAWGTNPLASALLRQMSEEYLPQKKTSHRVKDIRYSADIVNTVKKCFGGDISSAMIEWNYENALAGTLTGAEKETVAQIHRAADGWRAAAAGN